MTIPPPADLATRLADPETRLSFLALGPALMLDRAATSVELGASGAVLLDALITMAEDRAAETRDLATRAAEMTALGHPRAGECYRWQPPARRLFRHYSYEHAPAAIPMFAVGWADRKRMRPRPLGAVFEWPGWMGQGWGAVRYNATGPVAYTRARKTGERAAFATFTEASHCLFDMACGLRQSYALGHAESRGPVGRA